MEQSQIESAYSFLTSSAFDGGVIDVDSEDALEPELDKIDKTPEENKTTKFPKISVLCFLVLVVLKNAIGVMPTSHQFG